jgi:hypothetical protein
MITDDPATPGDGHWEINMASLVNRTSPTSTYQLPLIDVNYGLGERIQLKVEMPWVLQDGASPRLKGFGNALAGVKWRFYDNGEEGWRISTYPQVAFSPSTRSTQNGIASSGVAYLAPIEFLRQLGGDDINFELGRWFRPAEQIDSWIMGAVLTHEVRKGFELMLELHDEFAVHQARDQLILNVGSRWDLSDCYTILAALGRDLHNTLSEKDTFQSYLGVQARF